MNATLTRLQRLTTDLLTIGDGPLLDAFLAGDQTAFAVLVRRHAGVVFATCRRILRHQQDAEDAFQATFLVLVCCASDVWPREAVGSWLFGVAHRVALKARATRNRKLTREQPLQDVAREEPTHADFDLIEAVHRVIGKLPEAYRAAVVACDLEGLSRKEAAERLGWSEGTLSGRLARARELLASRLKRLGLSLPAGGLAAFAVTETASATAIQSTIELATGATGNSASASVVALTEGVVRSMALFKLKTMTAAVLTACAIGFGVLVASGAGAGAGSGDSTPDQQQQQSQGAQLVPTATKPADPVPKLVQPPPTPITDRDRLQGTWGVISATEGDKKLPLNMFGGQPTFEIRRDTLWMPYLEEGKTWKHLAFSFALDETKSPRTMDLIAKSRPVGRGIYEFVGSGQTCASCHDHPFVEKGMAPPLMQRWAFCAPAWKDPKSLNNAELRLALTIDGARPTKFGGNGVIVFTLKRANPHLDTIEKMLRDEKDLRAVIDATLDAKKKAEHAEKLAALVIKIRVAQALSDLHATQHALSQAEADAEAARAHLLMAKLQAEAAEKQLAGAKDRLKTAERAVADAEAAQPKAGGGGDFTVHVRTLQAAEKVVRVKATGKETVLDALVHVSDDAPLKLDAVSVWVVRDKTLLPVDLATILKGNTKTNHTLKPGDQLFVQVKAEK